MEFNFKVKQYNKDTGIGIAEVFVNIGMRTYKYGEIYKDKDIGLVLNNSIYSAVLLNQENECLKQAQEYFEFLDTGL